jgi:ribonuclease R
MSSIDDDYYNYDERHYKITGRRHGRSFRLGDQVRVGVLKVDTVRNEVDLFLAEKKKREAKARKQPVKMSKSKGKKKTEKRKRTKSTRAEPKKRRTGRRRKK